MVEAFLKHSPHLIVKYPIWECSAFKIGNRPLNPRQIENRSIAEKVNFAYDFIDGEGELITKSDLEIKIGSEIPQPVYLAVAQKLSNYATLPGEKYPVKNNPHIPAYAELFSISTKGCSKWAKLIHRQRTPNILSNEIKMSQKFDIQGGEERRKQAYLQNEMIRYGNNIRWLNSQIMRGSLPTNSYLLKAKIKNSDRCSFCKAEVETIEHLFWSCRVVNAFLTNTEFELSSRGLGTDIPFGTDSAFFREIMFLGDNRTFIPPESPYMLDQLKRFIWLCRCRNSLLSWFGFRNFIVKESNLDKCLSLRYPDMRFLGNLGDRLGIG